MCDWNTILEERKTTILESLEEARLVSIGPSEHGFQIVELCDGYYGNTLTKEQMERLITELQQLLNGTHPAYPPEPISEEPIRGEQPVTPAAETSKPKEAPMAKYQHTHSTHHFQKVPEPDNTWMLSLAALAVIAVLMLSNCGG